MYPRAAAEVKVQMSLAYRPMVSVRGGARRTVRGLALVGVLAGMAAGVFLLVGGCKQKGKGANATEDKSLKDLAASGEELRTTNEELLKRRGTLQRSRAEIEAERQELEKKRASLEKNDIDGHAKLAQEEQALKEKEAKLQSQAEAMDEKLLGALRRQEQFYVKASAALSAHSATSGASDPTAGVRGREQGIAQREKAVAIREQEVARREAALNEQHRKLVEYRAQKCAAPTTVFTTIAAPTVPATTGGGRDYSKADAEAAYSRAMAVLSTKGILLADLPAGFSTLISDIRKSIAAKEYTRAKVAADQLRTTLAGIKIDRSFVGAKMSRLAGIIRKKKLPEKKRKEVNDLFVKVTTAYNDGRFAAANGSINRIFNLIR